MQSLWMIAASFLFACMGVCVKFAAADFSAGEIVLYRSVISLLLGVGGFGTAAQLAMTRAYKRGRTLVAASLAYTTVIFASLFGVLFWRERLSAGAWSAIALIVASGIAATVFSRANPAGQD